MSASYHRHTSLRQPTSGRQLTKQSSQKVSGAPPTRMCSAWTQANCVPILAALLVKNHGLVELGWRLAVYAWSSNQPDLFWLDFPVWRLRLASLLRESWPSASPDSSSMGFATIFLSLLIDIVSIMYVAVYSSDLFTVSSTNQGRDVNLHDSLSHIYDTTINWFAACSKEQVVITLCEDALRAKISSNGAPSMAKSRKRRVGSETCLTMHNPHFDSAHVPGTHSVQGSLADNSPSPQICLSSHY